MVYNLEKTLDNIEKKGMEKQANNIAIEAIKMGLSNEMIIKLTGLKEEEIDNLRKLKNN